MLQKDRCLEESPRLLSEHGHLQIWFADEWKAVSKAIQTTDEGKRFACSVPLLRLTQCSISAISIQAAQGRAFAAVRCLEEVPRQDEV